MPNFAPCPDKCEKAFRKYIEAQEAEELAGFEIVPARRHGDLPMPGIIFAVTEDTMKERVRGRGVFDVPLDIYVGSESETDPEGEAHIAAAGIVLAHLNDKNAVRLALNASAGPETREVTDFHVYDYFLRGQPTRAIADGKWETVIKLLVVCQGMDVPPV